VDRSRTALSLAVATLALVAIPARLPAASVYDVYFAGMHNHTGYSDGVPGTIPADAYAGARANGLDIMTVTEHSEGFDVPVTLSEQCLPTEGGTLVECALADGINSVRKWDANQEQAEAATDADFVALRGFEWTSDVFDHINVYFSAAYTNAKIDGGYLTMDTFWKWLRTNKDAIATFNHPGDKGDSTWNDFEYVPDADFRMAGVEVFNGGKSKDYFESGHVARALDKGWHLGLVGAQDTHTDDWGDPNSYSRTGFLLPALSTDAVRDAMLARRFYATTDANLDLSFTADGEPMGARLNRPVGQAVTLTVDAADPDGEPVSKVELFTNGGALAGSTTGAPATFTASSGWGEAWYLVRVTQADGEKAYSSPIWIGANSHAGGEWLAGDLHVHTQNGHDTCATPTTKVGGASCDEPWTWSFSPAERIALAKERGLDYLAITDHNNILSQSDPAWAAEEALGELILVPAYENSLPGHAQMLGAEKCYPGPTADDEGIPVCTRDSSLAGVIGARDALRADGGAFQINHPGDRDWFDEFGHQVVPDSVEVWNIGVWAWQPPAPSANDNDFAMEFYDGFLDAGYRVAATGGSDSHWRLTSPVQGVGQPSTWIFSSGRTWQDITAGIRAGHTFVSWQPPAYLSPRLFLEADADGNGTFESIAGDLVPAGSPMRVRADGAPPGSFVRLVTTGGTREEHLLGAGGVLEFTTWSPWVRAELVLPDAETQRESLCDPLVGEQTTLCRNRLIVLALTSPIYQAP
jgi:hypothetical protein